MSFDDITYCYTLQIVNGFVQPNRHENKLSTRVTAGAAMAAIANSRIVDLRYNRIYTDATQVSNFDWSLQRDNLVFQFPAITIDTAYGDSADYDQIVVDLGLV